jgi:hypothetical protein
MKVSEQQQHHQQLHLCMGLLTAAHVLGSAGHVSARK